MSISDPLLSAKKSLKYCSFQKNSIVYLSSIKKDIENTFMKKILVALSGGVDSSVAALILKKAGYNVSCAYIKTWMNEEGSDLFADCPWEEEIKYAQLAANHLDIEFEVVNLIKNYRERVVKYLVEGYRNGITPNPDIMCNREIKFGVFLDYALKEGFDGIATGHYCRRQENADGTFDILESFDKNKDQSYFLALVKQEQLKYATFPIGHLNKTQVRQIAKDNHLPNAEKKDSQGICFLGKVSINKFLSQYIDNKPGLIKNLEGKVLGEHKGLHHFTIGQRKGIGIPSNSDNNNYVVVTKNYDTNELIIAFDNITVNELYINKVKIRNINFINQTINQELTLLAKPRYRDSSQEILFKPYQENNADIEFATTQRALAQGQILALYDGERLLGGGVYY